MKKVCILMATYNGEKFIEYQIKSIQCQSYENWILYIRDDGSSDKTVEIIRRLAVEDARIQLVDIPSNNRGQLMNFSKLMKFIKKYNYEYIMFSDQDDVWNANKIEKTLHFMKLKENGPTMIYTNYIENGVHNKRTVRYPTNFQVKYGNGVLLFQNWTMGCTMMVNRQLLALINGVPLEAENHDNWIMLIALTYGNIYYFDEVTMFHRIHNNNVTNNFSKRGLRKKFHHFIKEVKNRKHFQMNMKLLMEDVMKLKSVPQSDYVSRFYSILNQSNKFRRIQLLRKNGFYGLNFHKTLELWLKI